MQSVASSDKIRRKFLEMWAFTLKIKEQNPSKEKNNSERILTLKRGLKVKKFRSTDEDF